MVNTCSPLDGHNHTKKRQVPKVETASHWLWVHCVSTPRIMLAFLGFLLFSRHKQALTNESCQSVADEAEDTAMKGIAALSPVSVVASNFNTLVLPPPQDQVSSAPFESAFSVMPTEKRD